MISHSYAKIKVDLCDSLPLEKGCVGVCVEGGGGVILFFNLNDVAILNLKCADCYCVVNGIS